MEAEQRMAPQARGMGDPASRRRFLALVGGAGGASALSTLLAACGTGAEPGSEVAGGPTGASQPQTDLQVVNYLLFLEYLEQSFYREVVDSGRIQDADLLRLMKQIRSNETLHAETLEQLVEQLGGAPVAPPRTKFEGVIQAGENRILKVAATVENLGAAAYLGQAPNITDVRVLEAAIALHTVEARHAAALNELAGNGFRGKGALTGSVPTGAFAEPMTREEVLTEAAAFVQTQSRSPG